ncbi:hypothetical protein GW793_02910 [bacterium]|uniref:Glycosyltransferase RgtA/B/C/D-like domain-containing protein n=2 Tax=Katanobacteria TaxID=422282 RepID=A0A2M7X251_UNCKA|nr:hypothetical protein [bacterium]PIP56972.1 MAG: hypothetical protein COX05_00325 [candidate division WWE3 bacterium CG22_combo_CG10-13_8_21_14_all_39_12]PJA40242.1 MAG: hypothetical protein CO179_02935 [candidate division WWE3 bacterium CG_4_9_14_3_um_filter_39_7]
MENKSVHARIVIIIGLIIFISWGFSKGEHLDMDSWQILGDRFYTNLQNQDYGGTHVASRYGVTILWMYVIAAGLSKVFILDHILTFRTMVDVSLIVFLLSYVTIVVRGFRVKHSWQILYYVLLSPYVVAGLQLSTPADKFLTWFVALSVVTWVYVLVKNDYRYIVITGVCIACTLLTKPAGLLLVPMLAVITLYYSMVKKTKKFIIPLTKALVIGGLIFYISYPAMWVKPMEVLTSRVSSSAQIAVILPTATDTLSVTGQDWLEYILVFLRVDVIVVCGVCFFAYYFYKKIRRKMILDGIDLIGMAGFVYAMLILMVAFVLYDKEYGYIISERYVVPAVPLLTVFVIEKMVFVKKYLPVMFFINFYRLPAIQWLLRIGIVLLSGSVVGLPIW